MAENHLDLNFDEEEGKFLITILDTLYQRYYPRTKVIARWVEKIAIGSGRIWYAPLAGMEMEMNEARE